MDHEKEIQSLEQQIEHYKKSRDTCLTIRDRMSPMDWNYNRYLMMAKTHETNISICEKRIKVLKENQWN